MDPLALEILLKVIRASGASEVEVETAELKVKAKFPPGESFELPTEPGPQPQRFVRPTFKQGEEF